MLTLIARFLPSLLPAASSLLNPWILLVVVAGGGMLYFWGYQAGADRLERHLERQIAESNRVLIARGAVTERVVTKYLTRTVPKTQIVTETVEKEVVRYADQNTGVCLDPAWRGLHDAAAANRLPDAPGLADAAPGTPPTAAEAIGTVTANYGACHRTADRLETLQEWVRGQAGVR